MSIPNIGFNHQKTNQAEFEIIEFSSLYDMQNLKHDPQRPHRVSFFIFVYIEEGEGFHMVDFVDYPFTPGSMIFIQREQVHSFDLTSAIKGKVILFTQSFLDKLHTNMRLPNYTPTHLNQLHSPIIQFDEEDNLRASTLINEILAEQRHTSRSPLIVMYLFSALALHLHRLQPESIHDKLSAEQSVRLARFIELIQNNFDRVRDANWYAHQLNTTYKTLNQVCKLATGLTVKQMIDSYITIEMKRRLIISNTTSQQIAYDFGFEDASNFVKYFKKLTGLTPTQFQKKHHKPSL
ncbi:helix-turn-helix domain-containing protein [Photobacterium sp. DNB22_13_2]